MTPFPRPERWSVYLRRSGFPVNKADPKRFDKLLAPYEDASLTCTGIDSHEGLRHIGLYDTVVAREELESHAELSAVEDVEEVRSTLA